MLVSGVAALIILGSLILIVISLVIRFWYLALAALLIILFLILYLEGLLFWLLVPIILLVILGIFSLITEQKNKKQ